MNNQLNKTQLVDWLVQWRQRMNGSISAHNHRRILVTRTKKELKRMYDQIKNQPPVDF